MIFDGKHHHAAAKQVESGYASAYAYHGDYGSYAYTDQVTGGYDTDETGGCNA